MWRLRRSQQERDALLNDLALDEVDEYRAAVDRIVGVAPMTPAQPSRGDGPPPNAPVWRESARPRNQPTPRRLTDSRDHLGHW
jgi:hypothetical protein